MMGVLIRFFAIGFVLALGTSITLAQRTVRIGAASGFSGSTISVPIELDALGNENVGQFSVNFDPAVLSLSGPAPFSVGEGAPPGTTLSADATQAGSGRLGILIETFPTPFGAWPATVIVRIAFDVAASAPPACSSVTFGDTPFVRGWANNLGNPLPTTYVDGCADVTAGDPDTDGDSVADTDDAYPNSDLSPTTMVGVCDSGVTNQLLSNGATFNDLIKTVVAGARNRGAMVSGVTLLINGWRDNRLITNNERNAIHRCLR